MFRINLQIGPFQISDTDLYSHEINKRKKNIVNKPSRSQSSLQRYIFFVDDLIKNINLTFFLFI